MKIVDLTIVGAGPAGLYASYYAGFRGFSVTLIDALSEIGGQVTAMYPEKEIFDVAGFPSIKGRDLINHLWEQASVFEKELLLSQKVTALDIKSDYITLRCESGLEVHSKTVLVTGGIGSFSPRPLPTGMQWLGKGLVHFVPDFSQHAGKDVVIVGGGDSAFDWALSLQPIAKSVTVVHRREEFRAHAATVEKVKSIGVRLITSAEIAEVSGDEVVSQVAIKVGEKLEILPCQTLVAALGFVANIGTMENWGFEVEKRRIKVGTHMESTLPRVFAAGDLATYPGKVPLISVGFGEAATAVNNAAPYIHQGESVFPKHSSGGD